MTEREVNEMKGLLRNSLPTMGGAELPRDLWSDMVRRLDQQTTRVPWWDWALLAGVAAGIFLTPGMLPALLYHL